MTSFSSQLGTKTAPGALEPFGWTRKDTRFRDARAEQMRQRVTELSVKFGHRQVLPPKQPLLKRREEGLHLIAQPQVEKFEIRHPRMKFTQSR